MVFVWCRHIALVLLFGSSVPLACAQGAFVSVFNVEVNAGKAYLRWTINEGNTCNGIVIQRSNDSVHYEKIGELFGVCGSDDSAQTFLFTDDSPVVNTVNYYKLQFGYQGETAGASVFVLKTDFLLVTPNPANHLVQFRFRNSKGDNYQLYMRDITGATVASSQTRGELMYADVAALPAGVYFYCVESPAQLFTGKILVAH